MHVDLATRTRGSGHRSINRNPTATLSWRVLAVLVLVLGTAACSSGFKSPAGTGGHSATGGATGSGGSGVGGAVGTGGSPADGGIDTPADDAPMSDGSDASGACVMVDGGYVSGDCCPDDPDKTQPQVCGCGVAETDGDNDGTPDCIDECPTDPNKKIAGICGCFAVDDDTDRDGTPDCNDRCPRDGTRTAPGLCGCGPPDNTPLCLAHRYRFDDGPTSDGGVSDGGTGDGGAPSGPVVRDSVGTAHGTAVNFTPTGTGSVTLAGGTSDQYINLPSHMILGAGTERHLRGLDYLEQPDVLATHLRLRQQHWRRRQPGPHRDGVPVLLAARRALAGGALRVEFGLGRYQ